MSFTTTRATTRRRGLLRPLALVLGGAAALALPSAALAADAAGGAAAKWGYADAAIGPLRWGELGYALCGAEGTSQSPIDVSAKEEDEDVDVDVQVGAIGDYLMPPSRAPPLPFVVQHKDGNAYFNCAATVGDADDAAKDCGVLVDPDDFDKGALSLHCFPYGRVRVVNADP